MVQTKQVPPDTSLDIVEPSAVVTPTRMDKFSEFMALRAKVESAEESVGDMYSIAERVLAASEEELWDSDEGGMLDGKDVVNIEQRIAAIEVRQSKNPDISNPRLGNTFVVVQSHRMANGDELIWNTSAPLLVTKLMRWVELGKIPGLECVVRSTDLGGGKAVLKLRPVPKRAI